MWPRSVWRRNDGKQPYYMSAAGGSILPLYAEMVAYGSA